MATFDFTKRYRVVGHGDIAWYVTGYETSEDEDYEWTGILTYNYDRVTAIMVGDDREFNFDIDELEALNDDEYCRECGQIGCTSNVYE